jgi:hypothetical protein
MRFLLTLTNSRFTFVLAILIITISSCCVQHVHGDDPDTVQQVDWDERDNIDGGHTKLVEGEDLIDDNVIEYDYEEEEEEEENGGNQLTEEARIVEYNKRGYTWPIPESFYTPQTDGWIRRMKQRMEQISQMPNVIDADGIEHAGNRYEGFIQGVTTGIIVQNFTQYGFGITKVANTILMDKLRNAIYTGLPTAGLERADSIIPGPNQPLLIHDKNNLLNEVVRDLQPYAEEWSKMKLQPYGAYGFRVYRNESQLYMHIDRPQTHVISFILHIASSDDSQPWPLYIEDLQGETHAVTLTSGDLLFYESCKLMHGRPKPLNGSWYSSVFVHYYPADGWSDRKMDLEAHYAVPPIWSQQQEQVTIPKLEMVETSITEPECMYQWCAASDNNVTVHYWGGPGEVGFLTTPVLEKVPFHPRLYEHDNQNVMASSSSDEL